MHVLSPVRALCVIGGGLGVVAGLTLIGCRIPGSGGGAQHLTNDWNSVKTAPALPIEVGISTRNESG